MRPLLAAAALTVAGVATAQAANIAAMTGHMTKLGMGCSALVYYVDEPDGFHLVVTTQRGLTDRAAVERFETVLAAGQSAAISILAARARRQSGSCLATPATTCTSPSRTPPLPAGDFPFGT